MSGEESEKLYLVACWKMLFSVQKDEVDGHSGATYLKSQGRCIRAVG